MDLRVIMNHQTTEKQPKRPEQAQAQAKRQPQAGDAPQISQQQSGSDSASVQFTDWASI
jgi:hypothetical protein